MSLISRAVRQIIPSIPQKEGAGGTIRRTIGGRNLDYLDPFLLLDEFNTDNPDEYISGFPDHPHRGFETVTYMLQGLMQHKDHKGNSGTLTPGAVQWMTAGKGIVHSEMPLQKDGKMHGFQMWVNLPAKDKMCPPRYQDYQPDKIPVLQMDNGVRIKIMTGESHGTEGAVKGVATAPTFLDIFVPPNVSFSHPITPGHTAWCYVIEGRGDFGSNPAKNVPPSSLAILEQSGDNIEVTTTEESVRFLLAAAKPLNEPMARYGPFFMNTKEEIMDAFRDYQNGTLQQ